jgi:DNA-binding MarR family transcriptional regulator
VVPCNVCYTATILPKESTSKSRADETAAETTQALLAASRALVGVAARSLGAIEDSITLPQYRALVLLASAGEENVGVLAEALAIHPSSATRLCDRLAKKGLIERKTSVESRREVTLTLTAAGRTLLRAVTQRRVREINKIVGRLDPKARRSSIDALNAFADAAGEIPAEAWKLGWTS